MGIDAKMLIRGVPRDIVTDEWLKAVSWKLCESIGASRFFTSDGLRPDVYEEVQEAWHKAFDSHPLATTLRRSEGDAGRELHRQILADIGPAPKCRRMAIEPTEMHYRDEDSGAPGTVYHEDSDDPVHANDGECLLEVSLWGRYYGVGYERGDILTYCAAAEWLEANLPCCTVWYGGDSSGVCVELFDDGKRRELRRHLFSSEGRDYYARNFMSSMGRDFGTPPACSLCPGGQYCGSRNGFGATYAAYHCAGCGVSVETNDSGTTWVACKDDA